MVGVASFQNLVPKYGMEQGELWEMRKPESVFNFAKGNYLKENGFL
jgi:hypothetical protein